MEIELDRELIRRVVDEEARQASEEIARLGPLQALRASYERRDARLAGAADVKALACKNGCAWCCYFTVDARPIEILNIVDTMKRALPADEQERIVREAKANNDKLRVLPPEARVYQNLKCPLLVGNAQSGVCALYSARPHTCRNYHATDAAGCRLSFEQPNNEDIDPAFAPSVYQIGGAHVEAFNRSMQDAGYDTRVHELNAALAAAVADVDECRRRFSSKERAFTSLSGEEAPLEFLE